MKLPVTRYYGSKRRVVETIWNKLIDKHINFDSFLDLFGGTGIVSYYMLANGKQVIYNDIFKFNCANATALLATPKNTLSEDEALSLLTRKEGEHYDDIIERNFDGIYYKQEENKQIDIVMHNLQSLQVDKRTCGFYLINQSCLIKRPFNLFHRNNLNLRLNHTVSKFGNYVTWEKSFSTLFSQFVKELNTFQFENVDRVRILNENALECNANADVIYIDTPYFNDSPSSNISYHSRYHFLEGLQNYEEIEQYINENKANKEIEINNNADFENKSKYLDNLMTLFDHYRNSTLVMSYTTKGYPSIEELQQIMKKFKNKVYIESLGCQPFALNRNNDNREEVILIGVD